MFVDIGLERLFESGVVFFADRSPASERMASAFYDDIAISGEEIHEVHAV